jgi:hypothetical protein
MNNDKHKSEVFREDGQPLTCGDMVVGKTYTITYSATMRYWALKAAILPRGHRRNNGHPRSIKMGLSLKAKGR